MLKTHLKIQLIQINQTTVLKAIQPPITADLMLFSVINRI